MLYLVLSVCVSVCLSTNCKLVCNFCSIQILSIMFILVILYAYFWGQVLLDDISITQLVTLTLDDPGEGMLFHKPTFCIRLYLDFIHVRIWLKLGHNFCLCNCGLKFCCLLSLKTRSMQCLGFCQGFEYVVMSWRFLTLPSAVFFRLIQLLHCCWS